MDHGFAQDLDTFSERAFELGCDSTVPVDQSLGKGKRKSAIQEHVVDNFNPLVVDSIVYAIEFLVCVRNSLMK